MTCGRSSPWIVNAHRRSRIGDSSISRVCARPGSVYMPSMIGWPPPPCSTMPGAEVGEPVLLRVRAALVVDDHVIVVQVRDRTAAVTVQAERERADHVGLEVVHEVAADEIRRVRDLRAQQEPRRLPRAARDDHDARASPRARCRRRRGSARRVPCARSRRAARARRTTRAGSRSGRCAARCAAARPGRPWRRSGSRRSRRTRSCCTRAGRRREPSSRPSARGTGCSRAAARLRS